MESFISRLAKSKVLLILLILVYLFLLSPQAFNYFGSYAYINFANGAALFLMYLSLIIGWLMVVLILGFAFIYSRFRYRIKGFFMVLFIVFILAASIIELENWRVNQELKKHGRLNYAVCIDKTTRLGSHIVYYSFKENRKLIYGHEEVSLKLFEKYDIGDTIFTINCSSLNHKIFKIEGAFIGEYED